MDDFDCQPDGVSAQLVSAVIEGRPTPALYTNLDRLLRWLARPDAAEATPIDVELQSRSIETRWARRLALMLLEEMLFSGSDREPARVLGFDRGATKARIQKRYHLLMRVYHPDLSDEAPGWLTERAERVNRAYARVQEWNASPPRVSNRRRTSPPQQRPRVCPQRPRTRPEQRIRRMLGRPHTLRRRFLIGVLLACTALVVHTCIVNQAWNRRPPRAGVSVLSDAAAGRAPSWDQEW